MPTFVPFEPTTPLPAIGTPESLTLEFKATVQEKGGKVKSYAIGKSVAGLANALGGTILFGAAHADGKLQAYPGVDIATAQERVEQAIKARTSPAPLFNAIPLKIDSADVLAINVSPHLTGAMVGVRVQGDKDDGFGGNAWVYPLRVGSQTKDDLSPAELTMYMSPELRRALVLLSRIPSNHEVRVLANQTSANGTMPGEKRGAIAKIDEETNSFWLGETSYALDRIESVFMRSGTWTIVYRFFGNENRIG